MSATAQRFYQPWTKPVVPPNTALYAPDAPRPGLNNRLLLSMPNVSTANASPAHGKNETRSEAMDANWLRKFPNVRYQGQGARQNIDNLTMLGKRLRLESYMSTSKFYGGVEADLKKTEKAEKAHYSNPYWNNPEFLLSKANDREQEAGIEDPNSIAKNVFTDAGRADFDYEGPEGQKDQVGIVKSANASFANRRDRFFIPPQDPRKSMLSPPIAGLSDVERKKIDKFNAAALLAKLRERPAVRFQKPY
jgi:hypothetical protein